MMPRTLRPPDMNPEGITLDDWVRKLRGTGVGRVERITGDTAYVDWLNGSKEAVPCIYLRRAPSGEGKDRRR